MQQENQKVYFSDVHFQCKDCGRDTVWTGGEQAFLKRLVDNETNGRDGLPMTFTQPKRCPACRAKKRERFGNKK